MLAASQSTRKHGQLSRRSIEFFFPFPPREFHSRERALEGIKFPIYPSQWNGGDVRNRKFLLKISKYLHSRQREREREREGRDFSGVAVGCRTDSIFVLMPMGHTISVVKLVDRKFACTRRKCRITAGEKGAGNSARQREKANNDVPFYWVAVSLLCSVVTASYVFDLHF